MINNPGNHPNGKGDYDNNREQGGQRASSTTATQGNEKRRRVEGLVTGDDNEAKLDELGTVLPSQFLGVAGLTGTQQSVGADSQHLVGFNGQFLLGGQPQQQNQMNLLAGIGMSAMDGEVNQPGMNATPNNDQNNQHHNLPHLWSLQNQTALAVAAASVQPDPLPAHFETNSNTMVQQQQQQGMLNFQIPPNMSNFMPPMTQPTNQMLLPQSGGGTGLGHSQNTISRAGAEILPPHAAFNQAQGGFMASIMAQPSSSPSPSRSNQHQQYTLRQESLRQESDALIQQRVGAAGTGLDAADTKLASSKSAVVNEKGTNKYVGRSPVPLFLAYDDQSLSEYQCLVRKQIELFEAGPTEVESNAKGRNKPIVLGQVGIRCRHCCMLPPKQRSKGAMYYPAKLNGLYQAAQSMASLHLCEHCKHVPSDLRQELLILREKKSSAGGGKKYWGDGITVLGVYEDESGLRFRENKKQGSL